MVRRSKQKRRAPGRKTAGRATAPLPPINPKITKNRLMKARKRADGSDWMSKLLAEMPPSSKASCLNLAKTLLDPFNSRPECLHADAMVPSTCVTGFGRVQVTVTANSLTAILLQTSTAIPPSAVTNLPLQVFQPLLATSALNSGVNTQYYYQSGPMIANLLAYGGTARCLGAAVRATGAFGINSGGVNLVAGLVPGINSGTQFASSTWNSLQSLPQMRSIWCGSSQNFKSEVNWRPGELADLQFSTDYSGAATGNGGFHPSSIPLIMIQGGLATSVITVEFIEHFEIQMALGSNQLISLDQSTTKPMASLANVWSVVSGLIRRGLPVIQQIAGVASETYFGQTASVPRLGFYNSQD